LAALCRRPRRLARAASCTLLLVILRRTLGDVEIRLAAASTFCSEHDLCRGLAPEARRGRPRLGFVARQSSARPRQRHHAKGPRLQGRIPSKQQNLQRLRITGGLCRGHAVRVPKVHLRPMMSMVRESLFSMLDATGVLHDSAAALDLFSGSGIVGLEALSHGVGNVTFVDASSHCTSTIATNCKELGFSERTRVVTTRAESFLAASSDSDPRRPFDLVTLTPPYDEVDYSQLIVTLASSYVLAEDSLVVIEYPVDVGLFPISLADGRLLGLRNKKYGRTVLSLYVCQPSGRIKLTPRPKEFAPS